MNPRLFATFLAAALALMPGAAGAQTESGFAALARSAGTPQVPGLRIVYLSPLGDPSRAPWKNIILHQTEGPAGSARAMAERQARNPTIRGVTLWVETDGTVFWSVPETAITTHGDGADRNDNKYIDNSKTFGKVTRVNSIGAEFVGNYPDVRKPLTAEQVSAGLLLVKFLQERYSIPTDRVYAHNWIDYKDARYCEGCELAEKARAQAYVPSVALHGVPNTGRTPEPTASSRVDRPPPAR
jgi:hypothetical protein